VSDIEPNGARPDDLMEDEPPERRRLLSQTGRQFVPQVWGIIRTLGMYDSDNDTPHRALAALARTVREIHEHEEAAALIVFGDSAFLNGFRLRLDHATYRLVRRLSTFLTDREIGGLCFLRGFREDKVMAFLMELREANEREDPKKHLLEFLEREEIQEVTLINPHRHRVGAGQTAEQIQAGKQAALEVYARAMFALSERAGSHEGAMGRSRRQIVAVRRLVVLSEGNEETLLQMSSLRGMGSPVANHSLNTTIMALTLGRRAGLARKHLVRLGIAAMNHNVGEQLDHDWEWDDVEPGGPRSDGQLAHPLRGMQYLLEHHGINERSLQRALVAAEHHRHFNGLDGFPELPPGKPHLFSRMIAICDAYDSLVWSPLEDIRVPPDQALKRITRGADTQYDPVLVRLFAAMVGRYPPGALVELDDGDLGIVVARGKGEDGQSRPLVLHIRDALGRPVPPVVLDLGEMVQGKRRYVHSISRTRDPLRLDINVASYLFSEDDLAESGLAEGDGSVLEIVTDDDD
jgi:HD-GYP domain-containing protein (c-di-GMP phosphodiesterase class II)